MSERDGRPFAWRKTLNGITGPDPRPDGWDPRRPASSSLPGGELDLEGSWYRPYYRDEHITLLGGDCRYSLSIVPDESVHCVITSPPYWALRDYGGASESEIGQEATPELYIESLVDVFRAVRRVLRDDGTLWINIGDTYAGNGATGTSGGHSARSALAGTGTARAQFRAGRVEGMKPKDLVGIPWMLAFALRADGWYLRSDVIWHKPNPMPESVTDRPSKAHEHIFMLTKSPRYWYSSSSKARSVWTIATESYPGEHYAAYPQKLVERALLAGCPEGGTVLDPFAGSGTTLQVAQRLGRPAIGVDLNPEYLAQSLRRNAQVPLGLTFDRDELAELAPETITIDELAPEWGGIELAE